jgi:hypothetical protein
VTGYFKPGFNQKPQQGPLIMGMRSVSQARLDEAQGSAKFGASRHRHGAVDLAGKKFDTLGFTTGFKGITPANDRYPHKDRNGASARRARDLKESQPCKKTGKVGGRKAREELARKLAHEFKVLSRDGGAWYSNAQKYEEECAAMLAESEAYA